MDICNFYTELFEDTLGLDVLGLENRYKELVDLINRKTLVVFSQLIPCRYYTYVNLDSKNELIHEDINRVGREYYLADPVIDKFHLQINAIEKCNLASGTQFDPERDNYYSSVITSRQNISLDSILGGAESTYGRNLADFAIPFKKYFEYRGNRVLYLENWPYNGLIECLCQTNWPNIASIPEEHHVNFVQLAIYDVKIKLWNELKYLEDITLPVGGNLNLKINDWEGAQNERNDFIRELKTKSLPDRVGTGWFHVV